MNDHDTQGTRLFRSPAFSFILRLGDFRLHVHIYMYIRLSHRPTSSSERGRIFFRGISYVDAYERIECNKNEGRLPLRLIPSNSRYVLDRYYHVRNLDGFSLIGKVLGRQAEKPGFKSRYSRTRSAEYFSLYRREQSKIRTARKDDSSFYAR